MVWPTLGSRKAKEQNRTEHTVFEISEQADRQTDRHGDRDRVQLLVTVFHLTYMISLRLTHLKMTQLFDHAYQ